MELFGHVATTHLALRDAGMSQSDSIDFIRENAAKLCLLDAIRCKILPSTEDSGIVKYGRLYSHHTDGGSMVLPINEELKRAEFTPEEVCANPEGIYVPSIADGPTNFPSFVKKNPHLFTASNHMWGVCILTHLYQDVANERLYQHLTADIGQMKSDTVLLYGKFEAKSKKVVYKFSGKEIDGKAFRENIVKANTLFHNWLIKEFKIESEEIIKATYDSFDKSYDEEMAKSAKSYIKLNSFANNESGKNKTFLTEQHLIESGFCLDKEQLVDFWKMLLNEAKTSCYPLIKDVVFNPKKQGQENTR